jgi:N-acetylneuraminate synthase
MKPFIEISGRKIGYEFEPLVIAEIGINHSGSLDIAKEMVLSAQQAGVEFIKHQTHIIDDEMSSEAKNILPGNANISIYDVMKKNSLNEQEEYELMKFVRKQKMIFISTPFSRKAFLRLKKFDVPAYKIGSGECNNHPLIEEISKTLKPIILSTGMNSIDDIKQTMSIINNYHNNVALLHTTNLYPTPNRLVRLGAIEEISNVFPKNVFGLSDHTTSNHACFGAIALGASILERHFTDHMERNGPDIICSMNQKECENLIKGAKILFEQRGGKKLPTKEEKVTIDFAFASICTIKSIKKGELFTKRNIWVKRPGTGDFLAKDFNSILGKKAKVDIQDNVQLKTSYVD